MKSVREALWAYLATLAAIVGLTLCGVVIVQQLDGTEEQIAKVIAQLAFIGAATTGLIGVIGTFRPKGQDDVPPAGEEK